MNLGVYVLNLNTLFSRKTTFAHKCTIIAHDGLDDSVRNGKRYYPEGKSGEQNIQILDKSSLRYTYPFILIQSLYHKIYLRVF